MTHKRYFLLLSLLAAFAGLGTGLAGQSGIRRIEIVMQGQTSRTQPQVIGLREGLEELKYVDGEKLRMSLLQENDRETLRSALSVQIRRHKVDLIVALGTQETAVAKEVTQTIPILFLPARDPVRSGFVRTLAHPGGNITGLTFFTDPEANLGKQLEMFKAIVPSLRQVRVIADARQDLRSSGQEQNKLMVVASRLGIKLIEQPVNSVAEATKISWNSKEPLKTGIFVNCGGLFRDLQDLAVIAIKYKLPLFGCNSFQVAEQQVLMTYTADLYAIGYRGAWFADRIFKGARPQSLPVERPAKFDLVINRKTAMEIGLKIRHKMLMLADRVFD